MAPGDFCGSVGVGPDGDYLFAVVIKGSWVAIFRVTDEINPMQGGVEVYST